MHDPDTRAHLAGWLRAREKGRQEAFWLRHAEFTEAVDALLFVGLLPD